MNTTMTVHQVQDADLPDWRFMLESLHARFRVPDYDTGLRLVAAVGAAAQEQNHHPDIDLRYGYVDVRLRSHDVGGVTDRDLRLARSISATAHQVGATARPDQLQALEWALDTADAAGVGPFWAAVLGREFDRTTEECVDPGGREPSIWFQHTGSTAPDRQRWHLDVSVPPERAQDRIDAALAAGGRLVSEAAAPSFWVLADAEGNLACICTALGRD